MSPRDWRKHWSQLPLPLAWRGLRGIADSPRLRAVGTCLDRSPVRVPTGVLLAQAGHPLPRPLRPYLGILWRHAVGDWAASPLRRRQVTVSKGQTVFFGLRVLLQARRCRCRRPTPKQPCHPSTTATAPKARVERFAPSRFLGRPCALQPRRRSCPGRAASWLLSDRCLVPRSHCLPPSSNNTGGPSELS